MILDKGRKVAHRLPIIPNKYGLGEYRELGHKLVEEGLCNGTLLSRFMNLVPLVYALISVVYGPYIKGWLIVDTPRPGGIVIKLYYGLYSSPIRKGEVSYVLLYYGTTVLSCSEIYVCILSELSLYLCVIAIRLDISTLCIQSFEKKLINYFAICIL